MDHQARLGTQSLEQGPYATLAQVRPFYGKTNIIKPLENIFFAFSLQDFNFGFQSPLSKSKQPPKTPPPFLFPEQPGADTFASSSFSSFEDGDLADYSEEEFVYEEEERGPPPPPTTVSFSIGEEEDGPVQAAVDTQSGYGYQQAPVETQEGSFHYQVGRRERN